MQRYHVIGFFVKNQKTHVYQGLGVKLHPKTQINCRAATYSITFIYTQPITIN
jgi:hypothetical protein